MANCWGLYNKETGKLVAFNFKRKYVIPFGAKQYIGTRYIECKHKDKVYCIVPINIQTKLNPEEF